MSFLATYLMPAGLMIAIHGLAIAMPDGTGDEPSLDEIRAATEQYRDLAVALADGYVRDPANMCETAEHMGRPAEQGAMGVHYFRPDLLGISGPPGPRVDGTGTHTDFPQACDSDL